MEAMTDDTIKPTMVREDKIPAIREALAAAHATDLRHAAKAGRPAPEAPVLVTGVREVRVRCPGCRKIGTADGPEGPVVGHWRIPADPAEAWVSPCCGVPVMEETRVEVTVTSGRPTVGRFDLVAVVEGQEADYQGKPSPNLVRKVPGNVVEVPGYYRTSDPTWCDHCEVRRARSETFLLAERETGRIRQVGRQCLAAFLGGVAYEDIVRRLAWDDIVSGEAGEDDGEGGYGGGGGGRDQTYPIEAVVALAACVMRRDGWLSSAKAAEWGRESTGQKVRYVLSPPPWGSEARDKWRKEVTRLAPEAGDMRRGLEALAWAREVMEVRDGDDYAHSLRVACRLTRVDRVGLVVSALPAWDRAMGREIERKRRAALPSEYLGKPGDQIGGTLTKASAKKGKALHPEMTGTIEGNPRAKEGNFGVTTMVKIRCDDGRTVFQWWKSGEAPDAWADGVRVSVRGTIKAHDEYRGVRYTTITRADVEVLPDDAADLAAEEAADAAAEATMAPLVSEGQADLPF